jgi:hypothetical protein
MKKAGLFGEVSAARTPIGIFQRVAGLRRIEAGADPDVL